MNCLNIYRVNSTSRQTSLVDELLLTHPQDWKETTEIKETDVFVIEHQRQWLSNCFDRVAMESTGEGYFLDMLNRGIIDKLINKQSVLIIDGSTEGHCQWTSLDSLANELDNARIPRQQVILLTANYNQSTDISSQLGLDVYHHNAYLYKSIRLASQHKINFDESIYKRLELLPFEKDFICLNFTIRPHRLMLVASFIADKVFDNGYISFCDLNSPSGWKTIDTSSENVRNMLEYHFHADDSVLDAAEILRSKGRLCVDTDDVNSVAMEYIAPIDLISKSWFSVVTESSMNDSWTCFVTEKSIKPILMAQPFIVAGDPGVLSYLQSIGFKTFSPLIDEAYDKEVDPILRMNLIRREVVNLVNLPFEQKKKFVLEISSILRHNLSWLKSGAIDMINSKWTASISGSIFRKLKK